MIPLTLQPTLANRVTDPQTEQIPSTRQSLLEPPRGPLLSRFLSRSGPVSVSLPTLEAPGEVLPPSTTRPLINRIKNDDGSSTQAQIHRGIHYRGHGGRGGRGRGDPPSVLRRQPRHGLL